MKKYVVLLIAVVIANLCPGLSYADIFQKYEKVIWIDQEKQVGAAYRRGRMLLEFPILTGDDETPTPPGTYVINRKDKDYHSRKYDIPMPYYLFFDYRGRAIHEGVVPDPDEIEDLATHGCIQVEQPYMKWLYDWAEKGKTVVVVRGRRVWEDKEFEEDREAQENLEDEQENENAEGEDYEETEDK